MSKSKGNVVNPDDIVESHGADTLRMYEMFMGPLMLRLLGPQTDWTAPADSLTESGVY